MFMIIRSASIVVNFLENLFGLGGDTYHFSVKPLMMVRMFF